MRRIVVCYYSRKTEKKIKKNSVVLRLRKIQLSIQLLGLEVL